MMRGDKYTERTFKNIFLWWSSYFSNAYSSIVKSTGAVGDLVLPFLSIVTEVDIDLCLLDVGSSAVLLDAEFKDLSVLLDKHPESVSIVVSEDSSFYDSRCSMKMIRSKYERKVRQKFTCLSWSFRFIKLVRATSWRFFFSNRRAFLRGFERFILFHLK